MALDQDIQDMRVWCDGEENTSSPRKRINNSSSSVLPKCLPAEILQELVDGQIYNQATWHVARKQAGKGPIYRTLHAIRFKGHTLHSS